MLAPRRHFPPKLRIAFTTITTAVVKRILLWLLCPAAAIRAVKYNRGPSILKYNRGPSICESAIHHPKYDSHHF